MEEEFRLAKNYTALNKSRQMLIEPTKLKYHFEQHFDPRNTVTQPEIENPELFPHLLPPNNIQTNEEIPDEEEHRNVLKKQKDGKCRGTDEIYSEHLKYSTSKNLLAALLLLNINQYQ